MTCVGTNFLRRNTTWRLLSSTESVELKCSFRMPVLPCHNNIREPNTKALDLAICWFISPAPDLPFWEQIEMLCSLCIPSQERALQSYKM